MANAVRSFHAPNFLAARIPIQSNVKLANFDFYLEHYYDRNIVDFLRYGWPINYVGSVPSSTFSNHPSAVKNIAFLKSYVQKELVHRSICGQFKFNPFDTDCIISPLLCVRSVTPTTLGSVTISAFPKVSLSTMGSPDSYLNDPFRLRLPGIDCLVEFINKEGFKKTLVALIAKFPLLMLMAISIFIPFSLLVFDQQR